MAARDLRGTRTSTQVDGASMPPINVPPLSVRSGDGERYNRYLPCALVLVVFIIEYGLCFNVLAIVGISILHIYNLICVRNEMFAVEVESKVSLPKALMGGKKSYMKGSVFLSGVWSLGV